MNTELDEWRDFGRAMVEHFEYSPAIGGGSRPQCPYCLWVPGREWDPVHSPPDKSCDLEEAYQRLARLAAGEVARPAVTNEAPGYQPGAPAPRKDWFRNDYTDRNANPGPVASPQLRRGRALHGAHR